MQETVAAGTRSRGTREIEVLNPYTDQERLNWSEELVTAELERSRLKQELADYSKEKRAEIAEAEEDIDRIVKNLDRGGVMVTRQAELILDYDAGIRRYVKDGEDLKTEPLEAADYQLDLEDTVAENARREEEVGLDPEAEAVPLEGEDVPELELKDGGTMLEALGEDPLVVAVLADPEDAPDPVEPEEAPESPQVARYLSWTKNPAGGWISKDGRFTAAKIGENGRPWILQDGTVENPPMSCKALADAKTLAQALADGADMITATDRVVKSGGSLPVLYREDVSETEVTPEGDLEIAEAGYIRFDVEIDREGELKYTYQEEGDGSPWTLSIDESAISWSDAEVRAWAEENYGTAALEVLTITRAIS